MFPFNSSNVICLSVQREKKMVLTMGNRRYVSTLKEKVFYFF